MNEPERHNRSQSSVARMSLAAAALTIATASSGCARYSSHTNLSDFKCSFPGATFPGYYADGFCPGFKAPVAAPPPAFQSKLASTKNDDGLKSPFVAVQARKGVTDADSVTTLPIELAPGFRVDVTCGIFVEKLAPGVSGGMIGLEIVGADRATDLSAIYAERSSSPAGLTVRVVTQDGIQGTERFLPDATQVDLRAQSTGSAIDFSYRDSGGPSDFFSPLATVSTVSQGPWYPVTAVYDIDSKGQVGFTNLSIPVTGVAAKPKDAADPKTHSIDQIMTGVRLAMVGLATLNSGPPSQQLADNASFSFSQAMGAFTTALNDLDSFDGPQAERARKALDKAWRLCGSTGRALGVDPPEREVPLQLKSFAGKLMPLAKTALENIRRL